MAGKDTVAVFNATQRIVALKGQVKSKDDKRDPKRFCDRLRPGEITFVNRAFWAIYKRNKIVQIMLDEEKLMINKASKPKADTDAKKGSAEDTQKAAALAAIKANGGDGDDGE